MKYPYFLLAFLFITHLSSGQSAGFRYGARFGIGQANISRAGIQNQTGKLALNAGLTANYQFNNHLGLNADFLFTSKGSRASGIDTRSGVFGSASYKYEESYKLYYFEIPVMAKLSIGFSNLHLKVFAGPSVNFNLTGTQTRSYEDPDFNRDNGFSERKIPGLQLMEFAGVAGAGFDVEMDNKQILFLDARYSGAYSSFGVINGSNAYNNYFTVGVGYLY
jgi:hypothetical protein